MGSEPPEGQERSDPLALVPGEWSRRTTLRDGTRVLLRGIRPGDRDRLAEGFRLLSPASRFLRFNARIDELTDRELDYLSQVDHVDHDAVVAIDLDHPEVPGIGVARYIRDPYERHIAEAAITVADAYQNRGAGTLLLGTLAARARTHGVQVFRNYVLDENQPMLELLDELGASREYAAAGLWRVDLALPDLEHDLRDSPVGRAFAAVAGSGSPLASLFRPMWCHVPFQAVCRGSDGADTEEDPAAMRDQLVRWLARREQRSPGWPTPEAGERAETGSPQRDRSRQQSDDQPSTPPCT